jgi:Rrf2 family protein
MPTNTRFSVAVHVLALLALEQRALTSDYVAGSVQTNAVVVRRILGSLREAGIVTAVPGPGGGFLLVADPRSLTLRAIYEAVEERSPIVVHGETNRLCPVGRNIQNVLENVTANAEQAMLASLADTHLSKIVGQIRRCERTG